MSDKIVTIAGQQTEIVLEREGTRFTAGDHSIEILSIRENEAEIRVDGQVHFVPFVIQGTTVSFAFDGETYVADVAEKGARARTRHRDHSMEAPMPGLIVKIVVAPGDVVTKGSPLLILEAMKMEHSIVAPRDGSIASIQCKEGELVQPGVELITLVSETK